MTMRQDGEQIIQASIQAVLPDAAVARALTDVDAAGDIYIVAIGKAAWRMASAARQVLGSRVRAGVVVTKYGHAEGPIDGMQIIEAGHPVPDAGAVRGAEAALALVSGLRAEDLVVFLVSGGGSALFELPLPGVTMDDIADVTKRLLASGADITQINTVRKHLSAVKGGRFAQRCLPARVYAVVLSDVLGDPLDSIASGPAYPDATTSADALAILSDDGIPVADNVRAAIAQETPKALSNVTSAITGNVTALCGAAVEAARGLGYTPVLCTTTLDCEARDAGAFIAALAREIRASGQPVKPPCALVFGGETVVHVQGDGKGGRNQELALAAARGIAGLRDVLVLSVGSDGTDGPTDAAGGIVDGAFAGAAAAAGLSIDAYLRRNDAYTILGQLGGLVVTGPTGTNVNDLMVLLCR